mgnify:FL=1
MKYKVKQNWENAVISATIKGFPTACKLTELSQAQLAILFEASHPGVEKVEDEKQKNSGK